MLLNAMRQGATSWFARIMYSVLLVAAVLGLAMMDYNGMFRAGIHGDTVATVAGRPIASAVFDQTVRRTLQRQQVDAATAYRMGYINQILESEIGSDLTSRAASDLGIDIGDDLMTVQVKKLVAPYVTKDMSAKDVLQRILMNQGMSENQFVEAMRTEMSNTLLRNAVQGAAAYTPEPEARDLYQFQNEQRTIRVVILPNAAIRDYKEPDDKVLLPLYQAGQERYAIPELRTLSVAVLTADDLKKTMDISDEDLKKAYQDEIASFTLPERRVMEQAVLKDQDTAAKVAAALKKGGSLSDAVKTATGNASAFMGKQTFQKDGLDKGIADAAFAAAKGDTVGPVQTPLGWHVLTVQDILPPQVKSFDSVKDDLRKEQMQAKLSDDLYAAAGRIDDRIAGGASLEDAAQEFGMKIEKFPAVHKDGSTADKRDGFKNHPKDRDNLLKAAFDLNEGEASPVQELKDGSYAVVRVDKVTAKAYQPFNEVKADLKKVWIADQQDVLNKDKIKAALLALGNGEKTLEQIAAQNGVSVQILNLRRGDKVAEPLTPTARTKFFELDKGDYALSTLKDAYIVGQVTGIKFPDADKIPAADLKAVTDTATQGSQDEYLISWLSWLRGKYGVTINDRLLEDTYGPGREQQQN